MRWSSSTPCSWKDDDDADGDGTGMESAAESGDDGLPWEEDA